MHKIVACGFSWYADFRFWFNVGCFNASLMHDSLNQLRSLDYLCVESQCFIRTFRHLNMHWHILLQPHSGEHYCFARRHISITSLRLKCHREFIPSWRLTIIRGLLKQIAGLSVWRSPTYVGPLDQTQTRPKSQGWPVLGKARQPGKLPYCHWVTPLWPAVLTEQAERLESSWTEMITAWCRAYFTWRLGKPKG